MQKKVMGGLCAALIMLFSCNAFAEFAPEEKPVWGILQDTAYTLQAGEWNVDLWGPISYGIIDQLQVGTMIWVWFLQVPNANLKFNIIPESDVFPAITAKGFFSNFSVTNSDEDKISINWYTASAHISKQVAANWNLSAAYTYNGFDASASISSDDSPIINLSGNGNRSGVTLAAIASMSPIARFFAEGSAWFSEGETNYDAGGAFEWAFGKIFRLKVGIYAFIGDPNIAYLPVIDLHWRFK